MAAANYYYYCLDIKETELVEVHELKGQPKNKTWK